jgi:hypothetical protein
MARELAWSNVYRNLQDEWEETLLEPSRAWSEIEDDVRFGWEQASREEFDAACWDDVEHVIRRRWESVFPDRDYGDWQKAVEKVQRGFDRGRARTY